MAVKRATGHLKDDQSLDRNYLKGREGDPADAVLAATGHNFNAGLRSFCAP
jgi:transposase, IS5 family